MPCRYIQFGCWFSIVQSTSMFFFRSRSICVQLGKRAKQTSKMATFTHFWQLINWQCVFYWVFIAHIWLFGVLYSVLFSSTYSCLDRCAICECNFLENFALQLEYLKSQAVIGSPQNTSWAFHKHFILFVQVSSMCVVLCYLDMLLVAWCCLSVFVCVKNWRQCSLLNSNKLITAKSSK